MSKVRIGRSALHMWEEPCISGDKGSGAIFFCGCNLKCVFCQNYKISRGSVGHIISEEELSEEMLKLQELGANNINLVTAGHFMETVIPAIESAKRQGLTIPILYNTSAYEDVDRIKSYEGIIDIYLPDLKYFSGELSLRYSNAYDYFKVASIAIDEMVRQTKNISFTDEDTKKLILDVNQYQSMCDDKNLIMTKGTIVRHMLLPGCTLDSKRVIEYLLATYRSDIFISVMNQYTPMEWVRESYPEIYRKVTDAEYEEVLDFAIALGLENGFFQDGDVAMESFIPEFN